MLKKEDIVNLQITDITANGEGVGKVDGFTLFVKDAVIGDKVSAKIMKMKKTYGYARLLEIVEPSKDRVKPRCPVARQCGGCQIQQMDYEAQLRFKKQLVENNLARVGGFTGFTCLPVLGMEEPYHYRNKAQFPVGTDKEGNLVTGFYAGRTHHIVAQDDCCIGDIRNAQILAIVKDYMKQYNILPYQEESHTGLVRHILIRTGFHTNQVMVCLIVNAKNVKGLTNSAALAQALQNVSGMTSLMVNFNTEKTNVILGKKSLCLWGKNVIEDTIGDIRFQISPQSFFQVNPRQTEVLYGKALEFAALTGKETVWDIYCGIGTISLFLAKQAKQVYGVEIVPEAIADAKKNAALNGIDNAEFYVGKAEEVVPAFYKDAAARAVKDEKAYESIHPDVVVVDPPRKGCETSVLDTIVLVAPKRIVYVSCDSATLARDLKYLAERGYFVDKVQPVDQFAHSVHIETVTLLHRVNS